jgi:hypothetical protein
VPAPQLVEGALTAVVGAGLGARVVVVTGGATVVVVGGSVVVVGATVLVTGARVVVVAESG